MRVDAADLEAYKAKAKGESRASLQLYPSTALSHDSNNARTSTIVITGQDASLDILAKHIEKTFKSLPAASLLHGKHG